jgi:anti-sigma regulatory factor (Ser/Thr protein kinase)
VGLEAACELASDRATPAAARSFVARMLRLWECTDTEELAALLTSELVTNAVVHAATRIVLRIQLEELDLRVEVEDGLPELPSAKALTAESEHGRGLLLLDSLSRRWGAAPTPSGKVVWFELTLPAPGEKTSR